MHPSKGPDAAARVRSEHDVHGFVTRTCFKTGPPGRVGVEGRAIGHSSVRLGRGRGGAVRRGTVAWWTDVAGDFALSLAVAG